MLCFRPPKTKDDQIEGIRISRLPSQRYTSNDLPRTPKSPRFDERGVQKDFGMGKFRKSQKIRQKNKELLTENNTFTERAVDVPRIMRGESILKEQNYLPPGPDRFQKPDSHNEQAVLSDADGRLRTVHQPIPEKITQQMPDLKAGNTQSLPPTRKQTSKSAANTPKTARRGKTDSETDFRFSRSRSLPHRRVKNFVPFDV